MTCRVPVMILGPPLAPAVMVVRPSLTRMVGDMLESGRLPGSGRFRSDWRSPKRLASPGMVVKSFISLLRTIPSRGTARREPKLPLMVWVQATVMPSASMTLKWLVPASRSRSAVGPRDSITPQASAGMIGVEVDPVGGRSRRRRRSRRASTGTSTKSASARCRARSANACRIDSVSRCEYAGGAGGMGAPADGSRCRIIERTWAIAMPTGTRRRHQDRVAWPSNASRMINGGPPGDPVVPQVRRLQDAVVGTVDSGHEIRGPVGSGPGGQTFPAEAFEEHRELGLPNHVARLEVAAAAETVPDPAARGSEIGMSRAGPANRVDRGEMIRVHAESVPGRADRGFDQASQRERTESVVRRDHAGELAGNRDGATTEAARVVSAGGGRKRDVVVRADAGRRGLSEVERDRFSGRRIEHEHEPAATETAGIGPRDGEREGGGDRRIDRVASGLQDLDSRLARQRRIRRHGSIGESQGRWGRGRWFRERCCIGVRIDGHLRRVDATGVSPT